MENRRRVSRQWISYAAAGLLAASAYSAEAHDFSAERIVKNGKKTVTAHVNAKDDRWRLEYAQPQRGADVVIVRADRNSAWLILSKRRQYAEVPIASEYRLGMSETMEGEQSRELLGVQALNGYPTELFEVTVTDDGGPQQYYQWVTKQERFPIKTVSKGGDWSEEYRRVVFTEQSAHLFELPRRLDPVGPPSNPGPDGGAKGEHG